MNYILTFKNLKIYDLKMCYVNNKNLIMKSNSIKTCLFSNLKSLNLDFFNKLKNRLKNRYHYFFKVQFWFIIYLKYLKQKVEIF
jgi:hypothetical protein